MRRDRWRRFGAPSLALLLAACATPPPPSPAPAERVAPVAATQSALARVRVDESAMLPLLGYLQLLTQLSGPELARERRVLAAIPQTPATRVRQAMLFGQARSGPDLARASGLLEQVLKSSAPAAVSLQPLVLALFAQYQERLRLLGQGDRLQQQLGDAQRQNGELEQKLDALAAVERSLPERGGAGDATPRSTP